MYKYVKKERKKSTTTTKNQQKNHLCSIVNDIRKSAQVPKCLIIIVKGLKTKIAHTVTKGKRHSAGCTCEGKKSYKDVWMREWEEYTNGGWMFLNKRPIIMCLAKKKKSIESGQAPTQRLRTRSVSENFFQNSCTYRRTNQQCFLFQLFYILYIF